MKISTKDEHEYIDTHATEEFYEKESKQYIRDEDIMAWWEDNKK